MNIKVILVCFLVAASAELICLARNSALLLKYDNPISVFVGIILGNIITLLPLMIFSNFLHNFASPAILRYLVGLSFIIFGIATLFDKH